MWLIIRREDNAVVGTAYTEPPAGAWDVELFVVKRWRGSEPALHNPAQGVESYDPTPNDPRSKRIEELRGRLAADSKRLAANPNKPLAVADAAALMETVACLLDQV